MPGIHGIGPAKMPQANFDSPSRRPGTAGHPGKHLGHFKHAAKAKMHNSASVPLIQQQLNAMNTGKAEKTTAQAPQQNDLSYQIALDALRSTEASISDSLSFTSRFNAISTAFF